jgi:hypothetical protein
VAAKALVRRILLDAMIAMARATPSRIDSLHRSPRHHLATFKTREVVSRGDEGVCVVVVVVVMVVVVVVMVPQFHASQGVGYEIDPRGRATRANETLN